MTRLFRSVARFSPLIGLLFTASALACPVCGAGSTTWYEWQCTYYGWQLVQVGHATYASCSGFPEIIEGTMTDCFDMNRVPGRYTPPGECFRSECPDPPDELCSPYASPPDSPGTIYEDRDESDEDTLQEEITTDLLETDMVASE